MPSGEEEEIAERDELLLLCFVAPIPARALLEDPTIYPFLLASRVKRRAFRSRRPTGRHQERLLPSSQSRRIEPVHQRQTAVDNEAGAGDVSRYTVRE